MSGMTDDELEMSRGMTALLGRLDAIQLHADAIQLYPEAERESYYEDAKNDFERTFGVVVDPKQMIFDGKQNKHIFYHIYSLRKALWLPT